MMTAEQAKFVEQVGRLVQTYAPEYGIRVCSPIIAQAITESWWGKSLLASEYFNFFGMKTGSRWKGRYVEMSTHEEIGGSDITIRDKFRAYDSMEEGIKGYFEFIQLDRYQNLRGITDPRKYLETIVKDGYCTDSAYVDKCVRNISLYELTKYDTLPETVRVTEKDIVIYGHGSGTPRATDLYSYTKQRYAQTAPNGAHKGVASVRRFKGLTDADRPRFEATYRQILGRNVYSQAKRDYVYRKYRDGKYYSDCSSSGMATLEQIGYEVPWYLNTAGIYNSSLFETVPVQIKDGHIQNPEILRVGDAVLYVGNDPTRPLQIGHVEWVAKVPAQKQTAPAKKSDSIIADEVIAGKWGSGEDRKTRLTAAGYDYAAVQAIVNSLLTKKKSVAEIAAEVVAGKWGNGADRKKRLEKAGYDYQAVQKAVNKLLK